MYVLCLCIFCILLLISAQLTLVLTKLDHLSSLKIRYLILCFLIAKILLSLIAIIVSVLQPRECMRAAEVNTVKRLETAFADLKCQNILGLGEKSTASNVLGPRRGGLPV